MDRNRGPKPYYTASGEVARLEAIKVMYADDPIAVANAQRTLDAFRAKHPELTLCWKKETK